MKQEFDIHAGLPQKLIDEVRQNRLPVHIQRGFPFTDENGTEMETVIVEYPDEGFDFNALMADSINKYLNENNNEKTE